MKLILTCEHGGNRIPDEYGKFFSMVPEVLNSHRALDSGALDLFRALSPIAHYVQFSETCRLLIDLNRSLQSSTLFSEFTSSFNSVKKEKIVKDFYTPYRQSVIKKTAEYIASGTPVIHVAVHTFTPELNGEVRKNDIGLLFDPENDAEEICCRMWQNVLQSTSPSTRVMFNYPYLGTTDGLTKDLRNLFPLNYAGIELEVNQKYTARNTMDPEMKKLICKSLAECIRHIHDNHHKMSIFSNETRHRKY